MRRRTVRFSAISVLAGLALIAACSASPGSSEADDAAPVTVTLRDDMTIDVARTDFAAGETVTFEVTNLGEAAHEFYIGDAQAQAAHAEEIAEMGAMAHDEPNGVAVEPGQTETLEHTFSEAGEILGGCHMPGHYEAGMAVTLTVGESS